MKTIKFAVTGCGHIGKRHVKMIQDNPGAELKAICDIRPLAELGFKDIPDVPFYRSYEEMLKKEQDIDVVNICTPNGLHTEQSLAGLRHNRHIVCEKPIGLKKAEVEKVISLSLQNSKKVFCVMQNRYSPPSKWIKEVTDKRLLGEIYMVIINCLWNRDERYYNKSDWKGDSKLDGGTLFTQFSHFIDLMYWLFGDIENIRGDFRDFNHKGLTDFEDSGIVNFSFINGGMGVLNYSTSVWNSNLESSMTVTGSKGSVKVGGQYMDKVEFCNIKGYEMPELEPCNPPNDYGEYKGSAANHHFIIQNVIDNLMSGKPITTNALEGMKVVEIIEKIYAVRGK